MAVRIRSHSSYLLSFIDVQINSLLFWPTAYVSVGLSLSSTFVCLFGFTETEIKAGKRRMQNHTSKAFRVARDRRTDAGRLGFMLHLGYRARDELISCRAPPPDSVILPITLLLRLSSLGFNFDCRRQVSSSSSLLLLLRSVRYVWYIWWLPLIIYRISNVSRGQRRRADIVAVARAEAPSIDYEYLGQSAVSGHRSKVRVHRRNMMPMRSFCRLFVLRDHYQLQTRTLEVNNRSIGGTGAYSVV